MHPCFVHFITTHRGFKIECTASIESDLEIIIYYMYSHHQQGEEEDLKKSIVWVSCSEIGNKKVRIYTKTIGQGGLFNIKSGIFFRSDFLKQEDERDRG